MIELEGAVALVTGGSRGIGRAVAERLVECGGRVAIIGRDEEAATSAAASLGDSSTVIGVRADVSQTAEVADAVAEAETQLGPIDILINNAGLARDGVVVRMSEDQWDTVVDVNLKGAFNTIKAVARGMMKRRSGRIVNISSVVGLTGNRGQANYAASKAGLIGLTKSVAKELASRGILVNAVAPGFITTDMTDDLPEAARTALLGQIPLGRLGAPADVANAVVFLSSPLADYITGQVIVVDGGMVM